MTNMIFFEAKLQLEIMEMDTIGYYWIVHQRLRQRCGPLSLNWSVLLVCLQPALAGLCNYFGTKVLQVLIQWR